MKMVPSPTLSSAPLIERHQILVCVDLSPFTDVCLFYAISLARVLRSDLTMIHVMQPRHEHEGGANNNALDWEFSRQQARYHLERLEKKAAQALGRPVKVRLEQGHPAERIVEIEKEIRADLTVIGSHGESGVTAWGLGSTVHQVLAVSRSSVFIAHAASESPIAMSPERIIVPLDGSLRTECVLPTATRIARAHRAELILVHVIQEQLPTSVLHTAEDLKLVRQLASHMEISAKTYLEGLRAGLARDGDRVRTVVVQHANQSKAIIEVAKHERANFIVVAAHGANCDGDHSHGCVTEYLLTHSEVPVLMLQDRPEGEMERIDFGEVIAPPLRASYLPELM
ncbi:universal stress protein [Vreelandella sulfidaeris]|uniref:universal stress protein n=1 Tax=Vreelandella sulfidaeris TaxID=115553 RepID=UPI0035EDED6A